MKAFQPHLFEPMLQLVTYTSLLVFGQSLAQHVEIFPLFSLLGGVLVFARRRAGVCIAILAICVGSIQGKLREGGRVDVHSETSWFKAHVTSTPHAGRRPGEVTFISYLRPVSGGGSQAMRLKCSVRDLPWRNAVFIERGGQYVVYARVSPHPPARGRWARYSLRRGIDGNCRIYFLSKDLSMRDTASRADSRMLLQKQIHHVMETSRGRAYLQAMLLGDVSGFSRADRKLFQTWGISHLLVVSGLHVGALFFFIRGTVSLFLWLAFFLPGRYSLARYLPDVCGGGGVWWYVAQLEFPVSATRAAIAVTFYLLFPLCGLNVRGVVKILLAFVSIVSLWPGVWEEVGFQLTFAALFSLVFASSIRKRFELPWYQAALTTTLLPTLSTSLVLCCTIGGGSWLSPFGNILLAPFIVFIGFYGGLVSLFISYGFDGLGGLGGWIVDGLLSEFHRTLVFVTPHIEQGVGFVVLWVLALLGIFLMFWRGVLFRRSFIVSGE